MPDEMPLSAEGKRALTAEIRSDEHAARVRDFGQADAATYDQRVRAGADTIQHLEPAPSPVSPADVERVVSEIERPSYDDFLNEATERAASRMQGRDRER